MLSINDFYFVLGKYAISKDNGVVYNYNSENEEISETGYRIPKEILIFLIKQNEEIVEYLSRQIGDGEKLKQFEREIDSRDDYEHYLHIHIRELEKLIEEKEGIIQKMLKTTKEENKIIKLKVRNKSMFVAGMTFEKVKKEMNECRNSIFRFIEGNSRQWKPKKRQNRNWMFISFW